MATTGDWKWFVRGFLLTLLVFGIILFPRFAQTQAGGNAEEFDRPSAGESGLATDDPLGRRFIPLVEAEQTLSNAALQEMAAGMGSSGATDDPQGRLRVPLTEEPAPQSNAAEGGSPADIAGASAAAERREADLLSAAAKYTSPLVITAADFSDDGFDPDSVFFSFGGGYFAGNAANYGCLIAPAYLPAGATVTDMFVSVFDNDSARAIAVTLRRVDNFTGTGGTMATATTTASGAFNGVQTISSSTITNPVIAYPDYSYYVTACLGSASIRLYSVRLYYTSP